MAQGLQQIFSQIAPGGVGGFDQGNFLFARPALDLFFAGDGRWNVAKTFIVN